MTSKHQIDVAENIFCQVKSALYSAGSMVKLLVVSDTNNTIGQEVIEPTIAEWQAQLFWH